MKIIRNRTTKFLIISVSALIALYFTLKPRSEPLKPELQSEPVAEAAWPYRTSEVISFSHSMIFQLGALSIDGGPYIKYPCPPKTAENLDSITIGKIHLDKNIVADLRCFKSYDHNELILDYKTNKTPESPQIEYVFRGAYLEDFRSWLTKDSRGRINLKSVKLQSLPPGDDHDDPDTLCSHQIKYLTWNSQKKNWEESNDAPFMESFESLGVVKPVHVSRQCFSKEGLWLGYEPNDSVPIDDGDF